MSTYGKILFERKHEKVLKEIRRVDREIYSPITFELNTVHDTLTFYNVAKKTSRKVCRLRDIFWNLAYGEYHDDTDSSFEPDRIQSYNFGRMEIFV